MKIVNFKLDLHKLTIYTFLIIIILCIMFLILWVNNALKENTSITMDNENYVSILKKCHDNLENYIGYQITTTGYIFRVPDFSRNEFVVARDMILPDSNSARIIGFLCTYDEISNQYEDNIWVKVTGTIEKGDYYGEIPIIRVTHIEKITTPNDTFVYPPQEIFKSTSVLSAFWRE